MARPKKKEILRLLKENVGNNIFFTAILCIEVIFLGILLFKAVFTPGVSFRHAASDFRYEDTSNVKAEEESLIFLPAEKISDENMQEISGKTFSLPSGAYDLIVSYESDTDGSRDYTKSTGTITISSSHHEIEAETLTFDDGHNVAAGRFWIPVFSGCNDLKITVSYNGQGVLRISDCQMTEYTGYRAMRFLGVLIFFVIIDFLYILFFTDCAIRISAKGAAVLLAALIASAPFVEGGLYAGYDLWFHMARIVTIAKELLNGQFPVRISTELNNGFGYANPLYYCDIFLYLPAVLYNLHLPLRMCYQIYAIAVNLFTGISAYYAVSKFTDKRSLMFLGTMLYMLCAYRIANLTNRAALGEYTAMCFLPLVVVGLYNILRKDEQDKINWFPLAAGMSGVIMSHIVTAEVVAVDITILCIMSLTRFFDVKRIKAMLKAIFASVLLTAWFLVPFLDSFKNQKTVVQTSDLRMLDVTTRTYLSLFSAFTPGHEIRLWISIGAAWLAGFMIMLYCLYCYKNSGDFDETEREKLLTFRTFCALSLMNVVVVCKLFPWNRIQNLLGLNGLGYKMGTIQFSWRFFSTASILIAISVVLALNYFRDKKPYAYKICAAAIIVSLLVGCGYYYYILYDYTALNRWSNLTSYTKTDTLYYLDGTKSKDSRISECRVTEGTATADEYKKVNGKAVLHVNNKDSKQDAKIEAPIFAYNHYQVNELIDGRTGDKMPFEKSDKNCILITVPAGYEGDLVIQFVEPLFWRISEIISLLAWLTVLCCLLYKNREKVKCKSQSNVVV